MSAPLMDVEQYKKLSKRQKRIYWFFISTIFLMIIIGVVYGLCKNYM